jgi:hypothetical protein
MNHEGTRLTLSPDQELVIADLGTTCQILETHGEQDAPYDYQDYTLAEAKQKLEQVFKSHLPRSTREKYQTHEPIKTHVLAC